MSFGHIMNLTLLDVSKDFSKIEAVWKQLSSVSRCSYFLSWGWMENWLTSLPPACKPRLAVFSKNNTPIIAFFLKNTKVVRNYFFRSRGLFANSTGYPEYDNIWIEYNHFLCRFPLNCSLNEMLDSLPKPWDEFFLPGLDAIHFPGNAIGTLTFPYNAVIQETSPSPYVDLQLVRDKAGDYLSLLSSNTRAQIRRSYRLYNSRGPVMVEVASNHQEALEMFAEMFKLHKKVWQSRGKASPFSSEFVCNFHQQLIKKRFNKGEIQLLRIRAGDVTIGCLYNFVFNRKVYFYQSGMIYEIDKRLKPGLVSHVEAVKHNTGTGNLIYDFLGGISRYKTSLATNEKQLLWVKIQKPRIQFFFENKLRSLKNHFA